MTGPEHELSALDQVRQVEAEVVGRIAASREAAEQTVAQAREQAQVMLEEAKETGKREGQDDYRRLILQTQDEVRVICLQSQQHAETLRRARQTRMDDAVRYVVDLIAGVGENPL